MTTKEENKRDKFAINNNDILADYHCREIAPEILDDDLPDAFNEWIGTQSLEDLEKILVK